MSADVMQLPSVTASEQSPRDVDDQQPFGPVICYRDPADVRTIRRQARIIILCLLITTIANDAERVSESRRDLRQAPELRRLVKYRQGIAIIDTADPILFRFLPRADVGDVAIPPERELAEPERLADAVSAMKIITDAGKRRVGEPQIDEPRMQEKERSNHREKPGTGSKHPLRPIDLTSLIETQSEEEN